MRHEMMGFHLLSHYAKLYLQNGKRIVTMNSVTSFHLMYKLTHYTMLVGRQEEHPACTN